jgi:predicted double-glycine peptidase
LSGFKLTTLVLCGFVASSCISSRSDLSEREFAARYADFKYCRVPVIEQSSQKSCGAAALACVLGYWLENEPPSEQQLLAKSPPQSEVGYPLLQLRDLARNQGVLSFAVSLDKDPMAQLSSHIARGRPVIVAADVPKGRYFTDGLPLIESLDRRSVPSPLPTAGVWKSHYLVVAGISSSEVLLMDPQYGLVTVARDQFESFWKKQVFAALICSGKPKEPTVAQTQEKPFNGAPPPGLFASTFILSSIER